VELRRGADGQGQELLGHDHTAAQPIDAILRNVGLPATPPPLSPARGPPQHDLGFDADPSFDIDQTPNSDLTEPEPVPDLDFDQSAPPEAEPRQPTSDPALRCAPQPGLAQFSPASAADRRGSGIHPTIISNPATPPRSPHDVLDQTRSFEQAPPRGRKWRLDFPIPGRARAEAAQPVRRHTVHRLRARRPRGRGLSRQVRGRATRRPGQDIPRASRRAPPEARTEASVAAHDNLVPVDSSFATGEDSSAIWRRVADWNRFLPPRRRVPDSAPPAAGGPSIATVVPSQMKVLVLNLTKRG
jgi:hypothetical protein